RPLVIFRRGAHRRRSDKGQCQSCRRYSHQHRVPPMHPREQGLVAAIILSPTTGAAPRGRIHSRRANEASRVIVVERLLVHEALDAMLAVLAAEAAFAEAGVKAVRTLARRAIDVDFSEGEF